MSRLVVVRHAKSDYPWGVDDHDRPLNERGRRDAPALGAWLDAHVHWTTVPPVAVVSTARRAQLTWGLARSAMSARWEFVEVSDEERVYEASVPDLIDVLTAVARTEGPDQTVIIVGHNPGLAGLVHVAGAPGALRDEATAKFPTSAVAVLDSDLAIADALAAPGGMVVTAFAVPRG